MNGNSLYRTKRLRSELCFPMTPGYKRTPGRLARQRNMYSPTDQQQAMEKSPSLVDKWSAKSVQKTGIYA